jgi:AraC family transcriptional regulator of adaptative response/methylated-DNA-[protein]-cysteine methyltransferase
MTKIVPMTRKSDTADEIKRMADAIAFLTARYQEQPNLDEVAAAVGLSPYHFQRLFTRHVGVSPKAFVGHLTLAHAKHALENGASVLSAALEAGLSGPSRLYDLCLKIEAMTPGDYAKGGAGLVIDYGFAWTPFGVAILAMTDIGIAGLGFGDNESAMLADITARWPKAEYRRNNPRAAKFVRQIFSDERGESLPLHLMGTPFQIKVWQALLAIPRGQLSTYAAIARELARPNAYRAVGTAIGMNPISWLIPCHRVLGSSGALTGYHWGVDRKRAMLAIEAAKKEMDQDRPSTSAMTSVML